MSANTTHQLLSNQLIARVAALEQIARELKTKQVSGSDTSAIQVGVSSLSSNFNLPLGTYADIGLEVNITPTEASTAIVIATFAWDANGAAVADDNVYGRVLVDAVAEADLAFYVFTVGSSEATTGNVYAVSLTAAAHTIKMQAKNDLAARGRVTTDSTLAYWLFKT